MSRAAKTVCIYVPGIMTFPGESDNWTGRAVTWTHLHTPFRAEKVEYFAGPLSRVFGQQKRAHKLIKTLRYYEGWRIVLAGHSNGCDVILDTLRIMPDYPRLAALHLVSGACEADFDRNRLNSSYPKIGRICVYVARRDQALRLAATFFGSLLGYGALGLTGPVNPNRPTETLVEPEFNHSSWFHPENFDQTMLSLTGGLANHG